MARSILLLMALSLAGCADRPYVVASPPRALPVDPLIAAMYSVTRSLSSAQTAVDPSRFECEEIEDGLWSCPSSGHLEEWAWQRHLLEPQEEILAAPLVPADPVVIRDGLEVYDDVLHTVARRTRSQLDLWEHTPRLNAAEVAYFEEHPEVWADTVRFRSATAGRSRRAVFRQLVERYSNSPDALRHVLLRDGWFYFEDPTTANAAQRQLKLRELFPRDQMQIVLQRAGDEFLLERNRRGGHFYHTDQKLSGYRARLTVYDRIGLEGELGPPESYDLNALRRRFGVERMEVGVWGGAGRSGRAVFLNGADYEARLVRLEPNRALIGIVAPTEQLLSTLARSRIHAVVIYGLTNTALQMVTENLFFDEPANEVGQQDGIMRRAFIVAYRQGETEYTVNGVTYSIYDENGRPRPPQVCIDFITDVVERYTGSWWPEQDEERTRRTPGRIRMADFMRYRQVRRLVELAENHPYIAALFEFKRDDIIPFSEREAFYDNLWKSREAFRIGDIFTIYGLRSDGRNHWHSFFVYETDPVYGMPINLTDQAGHARIRSFDSVMSNAPARSIRSRVRLNPFWVLEPESVDLARGVVTSAVDIAEATRESTTLALEP